ncbi:MerR family transcriptional regulator [Nocardia neocaledoniensis]|uniref:MerR family transcriptional regulator n=1 Tax=Nocardia neocaledoniensis TaxID=236511 RepID=UPI002455310C|nr:MerR family transcriptional regulator [Nocardia neocaledoniensis]
MSARLRTSEVAAAAGVNTQTLRYYERRGLLAEPERTLGGQRLYPEQAVTVLRVIKAAQRLGFTLDEIAELLAATHRGRRRAEAGLQARATKKLAEIDTELAELTAIRDTLRAAVAAGCDDLLTCGESPTCPVPFEPTDRTVTAGSPQAIEVSSPVASCDQHVAHDPGGRLPR